MAGSSKILTVSYGTFSCTLEGFDNPFGTMQSIAEYFRDLAAEDRYFGAEPPQPDAQMLHQIAEREVRRRVEARVSDTGVVLRQVPEEAARAPVPETPPQPEPQVAAQRVAEVEEVEEAASAAQPETVAERLARIRQVVAKARAQRTRTYEEDEPVEDTDDESLLSAFASAEDAETSDEEEPDFDSDPGIEDESEPLTPASELTVAGTDDTAGAVDVVTTEEKLEHPQAAHQVGEAQVATVAAGLAVLPAERAEEAPVTPAEPEVLVQEEEEAAPAIAEAEAVEPATLEEAEEQAAEAAEEQAAEADEDQDDEAALEDVAAAAEDADLRDEDDELARIEAALAEATAPVPPEVQPAKVTEAPQSAAEEIVEVETEDDEGNPVTLRMTRAEFEAALANGEIEEVEDEDLLADEAADTPEPPAEPQDATTTAEGEIRNLLADAEIDASDASALAAELAEIEGAASAGQASASPADEPAEKDADLNAGLVEDEPLEAVETAEAPLTAEKPAGGDGEPMGHISDAADHTISRLIDETNAQMVEPEGNRRRSAIQHLRRAVMATRADKGLRRSNENPESIAQYRDDLEKVVRPERVKPTGTPGARPLGPLVLVSSQRVDLDGSPVRPVRPVRPAARPVEPTEPAGAAMTSNDAQSFSEFARKLGARDLPDLLEAAAAYALIVEGQEGFSRPALLRRAESASSEKISREEGLKSFGQLLRSGKIRKVQAGRFALSGDAEMAQKARSVH